MLAAIVAISCEEAEPEIITTDLPSEQSDRTPGGIGVIDTEAKLERAIDDLYYVYHGAYRITSYNVCYTKLLRNHTYMILKDYHSC